MKNEKLADRQVEDVRTAYIFGHYDSRGGAALVLADNHIEALKKYMKSFFCFDADLPGGGCDFDKDMCDSTIDGAQEDFIKKVRLVVCDEALPDDETDLDIGFNDDGYLYGKVEQRYESCEYDHDNRDAQGRPARIHTGDFSEWRDSDVFVMWKPKKGEDGEVDLDAIAIANYEDADPSAINAPSLTMDPGVLHYEFRLTREDLGEDACGLCLIL